MKLMCIESTGRAAGDSIQRGVVYDITLPSDVGKYSNFHDFKKSNPCLMVSIDGGVSFRWYLFRFGDEIIDDSSLEPGWRRCECGTITSHEKACCDCMECG